MAIAPLPETRQLELTLLDIPWPRPQLRLVTNTALEAGTGDPVELDPWPVDPAGLSHREEPPAPVALGTPQRGAADPAGRRRSGPSARVRQRRQRLAIALASAATLVALLAGPLGSTGNPSGTGQGAGGSGQGAWGSLPTQTLAGQGTFYTVQPGDTLASIAARIDPAAPRAVAADLERELGSPNVTPGEHIRKN